MKKKLFSLLLAVLMFFSLLPAAAFAADGTATITVGSITSPVEPGATIQIPVNISNNPGFAGAVFAVNYDANVLEPLTPASYYITNGSELPGTMSFTKGAFVEMSNEGGDFTGNGEIFVLNFTVKADTTAKSTEVSVALKGDDPDNFSNFEGYAVPVEFVSGTVAINGIDLGSEAKIGETTYDTLGAAIEAANSSTTTIEVLRDIDSATATKGYFTLDLCGKTIGTLNLYGGSIAATGSNSISGKLTNGTINNLNMTQEGTSLANLVKFGANITIGTVTATGKSKFEFTANTTGINITNFNYNGSQNWYMYSGTIENMSYQSSGGMLKQEGGTINHCTIPGGSGVLFSKKAVVNQLTDENKKSQCELGGTFGFDPSNYILTSNRWKWTAQENGDGTWSVVCKDIYVAKNKGYSSIGDACSAAGNNGTVTLGSAFDASKFYGGLAGSSSISKSITLDLKGYSLKPTAQSVSSVYIGSGANSVTLTNTGSTTSKLEGYSGGSVIKINKSVVTIDGNIELVGAANIPIFKKSSPGASYPCSVIIENATVSSDASTLTTIDNYAVDSITIKGGKFKFDPAEAADANTKIKFDTTKYHAVQNGDYYEVSEHTYGGTPTFAWAEDGKSAKVDLPCTDDGCAKHLTADAVITSAVKTPATLTEKGWTTYTAKTTLNGTEYTDTKDVQDIPKLTDYQVTVTTTNATDRDTTTADVLDLYAGDTVTVDVAVKGGTYIGADLTLTYDSSLFDVTTPDGWSLVNGGYRFIKAYPNKEGSFADGQVLGSFTFTAKQQTGEMTGAFAISKAYVAEDWSYGQVDVPANERGTKGSVNVKILAKPMTAVVTEVEGGLKYTGQAQALLASITAKDESGAAVSGAAVKYSGDYGSTYTLDAIPTGTDAKDYTVYYQITAEGYVTVTGSKTVTIAKADIIGYTADTVKLTETEVFADGESHSPVSVAPAEVATTGVTVSYSTNDGDAWSETAPALTDVGVYTMKVKITKANYNDVVIDLGTYTIKAVDYVTEITTEYVTGYDLVLVFTNTNAKFTYDGANMYDVTAFGYKYGTTWGDAEAVTAEGTAYGHVYAVVVASGATAGNVAVSNTAGVVVALTRGDSKLDLNGSNSVDLGDIVAAQAVYNVRADYLADSMAIVLRADVSGNKKVNTQDTAMIVARMLGN